MCHDKCTCKRYWPDISIRLSWTNELQNRFRRRWLDRFYSPVAVAYGVKRRRHSQDRPTTIIKVKWHLITAESDFV